jgi:hypothetical protein
MKKVYALNPVNFNHKKGEGMKGRRRVLSNIVTSIAAQEGGITACHLILIIGVKDAKR